MLGLLITCTGNWSGWTGVRSKNYINCKSVVDICRSRSVNFNTFQLYFADIDDDRSSFSLSKAMTYSPIWSFGAIIKLFTTYLAYLGHPLCIGRWKSFLGMGNIKHWRDRMKTCSFVLSHLFPQEFFCVASSLSPSLTTSLPMPCAYTIEAP